MLLSDIKVEKKLKQRENDGVKAAVSKWIKDNLPKGSYVYYKNWGGGGFNRSGRPDIEITYKGLVNYWELKDEKGTLSPLQKVVIDSYASAGKKVYVVDSLNDFIKIWNEIYKDEY